MRYINLRLTYLLHDPVIAKLLVVVVLQTCSAVMAMSICRFKQNGGTIVVKKLSSLEEVVY